MVHLRCVFPATLDPLSPHNLLPAAGAITSWRHIQDEGLAQAMVHLLRYLHDGVGGDTWGRLVSSLEPAVRSKLESMCR
jgi:hypothetical protein